MDLRLSAVRQPTPRLWIVCRDYCRVYQRNKQYRRFIGRHSSISDSNWGVGCIMMYWKVTSVPDEWPNDDFAAYMNPQFE
jgi:hypothetical protein